MAAEGGALSNCDVWLDHFENPAGRSISSQEITRLMDSMSEDGIMTFYKEWMAGFKKKGRQGSVRSDIDILERTWYRYVRVGPQPRQRGVTAGQLRSAMCTQHSDAVVCLAVRRQYLRCAYPPKHTAFLEKLTILLTAS